ncbi:hypothetical protein DFS34DRAFT_134272 [Phlyctochytrium arcticum]|nr:hypothetical protein DFS34DRAFT_134272 [Phlyctochytrium arcticum]
MTTWAQRASAPKKAQAAAPSVSTGKGKGGKAASPTSAEAVQPSTPTTPATPTTPTSAVQPPPTDAAKSLPTTNGPATSSRPAKSGSGSSSGPQVNAGNAAAGRQQPLNFAAALAAKSQAASNSPTISAQPASVEAPTTQVPAINGKPPVAKSGNQVNGRGGQPKNRESRQGGHAPSGEAVQFKGALKSKMHTVHAPEKRMSFGSFDSLEDSADLTTASSTPRAPSPVTVGTSDSSSPNPTATSPTPASEISSTGATVSTSPTERTTPYNLSRTPSSHANIPRTMSAPPTMKPGAKPAAGLKNAESAPQHTQATQSEAPTTQQQPSVPHHAPSPKHAMAQQSQGQPLASMPAASIAHTGAMSPGQGMHHAVSQPQMHPGYAPLHGPPQHAQQHPQFHPHHVQQQHQQHQMQQHPQQHFTGPRHQQPHIRPQQHMSNQSYQPKAYKGHVAPQPHMQPIPQTSGPMMHPSSMPGPNSPMYAYVQNGAPFYPPPHQYYDPNLAAQYGQYQYMPYPPVMQQTPPPAGPRFVPPHTSAAPATSTRPAPRARVAVTIKRPDTDEPVQLPQTTIAAPAPAPRVVAPTPAPKIETPKSKVTIVLKNPETGATIRLNNKGDETETKSDAAPEEKAAASTEVKPVAEEAKKEPKAAEKKTEPVAVTKPAEKVEEKKVEAPKPAVTEKKADEKKPSPAAVKSQKPDEKPVEQKKDAAPVVRPVEKKVSTPALKSSVLEKKKSEPQLAREPKEAAKKSPEPVEKEKPITTKVVDEAKSAMTTVVDEAKSAMTTVVDAVKSVSTVVDAVKSVSTTVVDAVKDVVPSVTKESSASDAKVDAPSKEKKEEVKETPAPAKKDAKPVTAKPVEVKEDAKKDTKTAPAKVEAKPVKVDAPAPKAEVKETPKAPQSAVKADAPKAEAKVAPPANKVETPVKDEAKPVPATEKPAVEEPVKSAAPAKVVEEKEVKKEDAKPIASKPEPASESAAVRRSESPVADESAEASKDGEESAEKPKDGPTKLDTRPSMTRLESFECIRYPESVPSPSHEPGMPFRYQRDFLMQFAEFAKEKPEGLPPHSDIYGDEKGGSSGGPRRDSKGPAGRPMSRQNSSTDARGTKSEDRWAAAMAQKEMGARPGGMITVPIPAGARMARTGSGSGSGRAPAPMSRTSSFRSGDAGFRSENTGSRDGRNQGGRSSRSGASGGGGHRYAPPEPPMEPVEPLTKSESAWVPHSMKNTKGSDVEDAEKAEEEVIARKMKGLLNKLTIDRFDSISDQIMNVGITRESILKGVIGQIFEKALDEPNFGAMYASLCSKLSQELPKIQTWIDLNAKNNAFRRALLNRCQEEFERGAKWSESEEKLTEQRREARSKLDTMTDEEKLKIAQEDYERGKLKRRVLGNMQFIGELFVKGLITEKIMHFSCIQPLLENVENPEEEDVESLCKLLNTTGARMDHDRAKKQFDAYFARIEELANNKKLAARIRFMLRDLIDLRKDRWANRNAPTGPKTIAQIRAEAEQKAAEDNAKLLADRNRGSGHRGMPSRDQQFRDRRGGGRGSSDGRSGVPQVNSDGWVTPGARAAPASQANRTGDMSNFGVMQKPSGAPMTFGPGGGKGFKPWGGKKAENKDANSMSRSSSSGESGLGSANPFALLEASGDAGRKQSVDEGSKEAASKAAAAVKTPDTVDEEPKRPTKQHAKSKFEGIVTEWFSLLDVNEVEESLKELNADNYHADLVDVLLNKAWDKKTAEVKTAVDLLMNLLDDGVVTNDQVKSILGAQIEQIPDMSIDVPDHYKNVGHLLGRLIARDTLTFADVFEYTKPLLDTRARTPPSTKLLLEILKDLKTVDSEDAMVAAWKKSELELKDWWPKPEEAKDDAKKEDAAKTVNDAVTKWQNMNDMTALTA